MPLKSPQLHVIFFPFLAHGHLIPAVDMARLFARHGVKVTIATTPLNANVFAKTIQRDKESGFEIRSYIIKFPSVKAGLPEGCENVTCVTSQEMQDKFLEAIKLLQQPLEQLLEELRPDCLVADILYPWATDVASKFKIPRLVFHGSSCFASTMYDSLRRYVPFKNVANDFEPFDVPGLPNRIKMTIMQLPDFLRQKRETDRKSYMDEGLDSEMKSYGVIVNSFYELEPAYRDHYCKVMGRKVWQVGPVSLCNQSEDKAERGNLPSIAKHECLKWLDSKKPNSVLYICFGSLYRFTTAQLNEIAKGLEASKQNFIWVVGQVNEEKEKEEWLLQEYEEKMKGKALIIRGWAPQVLILDHEAIGGFMSHCGWNSTIESICAGVPMITWPLYAEQFINEKLIVDYLKVGVDVGTKEWFRWANETKFNVSKEDIQRAVTRLMVGEEAEKLRIRARELKDMARRAVDGVGSSISELNSLLDELKMNSLKKDL